MRVDAEISSLKLALKAFRVRETLPMSRQRPGRWKGFLGSPGAYSSPPCWPGWPPAKGKLATLPLAGSVSDTLLLPSLSTSSMRMIACRGM
jgi:hypothetical protein